KTAIVSFTAAGALTIGTVATTSGPWQRAEEPAPAVSNPQAIAPFDWNSEAEEEYRYYFPTGSDGPMMLRARSGAIGDPASRQVLQNARANYFFSDNTVYINNHRMWTGDLSVFRIPTDPAPLTDFLSEVEGGPKGSEPVTARGNGLLVIAARDRGDDDNRPLVIHQMNNILDEDFFQGDWPAAARTYDQRDQMHRRGWTYFRIQGNINGQDVWGTGRVPFVAHTSRSYSPWLRLQAGSVTVVDTYQDAYVSKSSSSQIGTYRGGSFFKGLLRPWAGLHTLDTVRRDAAEQRIRFETKHTPGSPSAQVELDCGDVRLIYTIDLKTDVIDEITFSTSQGDKGNLKFSYLQSVDGVSGEFVRPTRPWSETASSHDSPGLLWLVRLLDASLE
ncbi:MAG: hypothetical protein ACYTEK_13570, partial [Planctomycetota bacterium]